MSSAKSPRPGPGNIVGMAAAYQAYPMWNVMPRLPDGEYLAASQMQIDVSNNSYGHADRHGWRLAAGGGRRRHGYLDRRQRRYRSAVRRQRADDADRGYRQ